MKINWADLFVAAVIGAGYAAAFILMGICVALLPGLLR